MAAHDWQKVWYDDTPRLQCAACGDEMDKVGKLSACPGAPKLAIRIRTDALRELFDAFAPKEGEPHTNPHYSKEQSDRMRADIARLFPKEDGNGRQD